MLSSVQNEHSNVITLDLKEIFTLICKNNTLINRGNFDTNAKSYSHVNSDPIP